MDVNALAGNVLLFLLVFGMSATVEIEAVKTQIRNYKALATGMLCQFLLLPLLGFCVVKAFNLSHSTGVTLLVVTSSPGGSYSNWFASVFNADLALSVSMTAISTFLSVIMLPTNLLLYTKIAYDDDVIDSLDWNSLILALVLVITAVAAGLYCSARSKSPDFNQMANHVGNSAGSFLMIFSAFMTSAGESETKIWARGWSFYIAVMLPCLGGLILANFAAFFWRLKLPEVVTVAIECCYQNVGIATSVALAMFKGNDLSDAMCVPVFYGLVEGLLVGFYCLWAWKAGWTKAPADTPFWEFFLISYEVVEQHKEIDEIEVSDSTDEATTRRSRRRESVTGTTLNAYFRFEEDPAKQNLSKEKGGDALI